MASQQAEELKSMLRQFREAIVDTSPTIEEQRASAEAFGNMAAAPDGVTFEAVDAGGIKAEWAVPAGAASDRVIQYVHGGGYCICSIATHRNMVGHIAKAVGCRALSVDYRMAPEHPHPAAVTDSVAAYQWLLGQGIEPNRIAISGDSAGGGLTLATVVKIRDDGLPLPAAAVPISPWTDLEGTGDSMLGNAEVDLLVGSQGLKMMSEAFLQGGDPRDPLASPLHADYQGLPPLYIQVGGEETLLDDSVRVADKATAAGVDVRLDVFPEMQHVFQMSAGNMPEADEAIRRIGDWLRPRLGL